MTLPAADADPPLYTLTEYEAVPALPAPPLAGTEPAPVARHGTWTRHERRTRKSAMPDLTPARFARRQQARAAAASLFARLGFGGVGLTLVAQAAHLAPRTCEQLYANRDDLLADLLSLHVHTLNQAVGGAFDAAAPAGPVRQLEAMARAWLDHAAAYPDAHRTLLLCGHLLMEPARDSILGFYGIILDSFLEPLCGALPSLAPRAEARASLRASLAALLNDPGFWPAPPGAAERGRRARRIAGMLLAAGAAEVDGDWPGLGSPAGAADRAVTLPSRMARTRLPEVLDLVAGGTEVVITRRGQRVARVVRGG